MRHRGFAWVNLDFRDPLPEECPADLDHAIEHLESAKDSDGDPEQVMHDLDIAVNIISRIWEKV